MVSYSRLPFTNHSCFANSLPCPCRKPQLVLSPPRKLIQKSTNFPTLSTLAVQRVSASKQLHSNLHLLHYWYSKWWCECIHIIPMVSLNSTWLSLESSISTAQTCFLPYYLPSLLGSSRQIMSSPPCSFRHTVTSYYIPIFSWKSLRFPWRNVLQASPPAGPCTAQGSGTAQPSHRSEAPAAPELCPAATLHWRNLKALTIKKGMDGMDGMDVPHKKI